MVNPAPTGHSRFGASKAERWLACPGSVGAEAPLPDSTSEYAAEGTALHAVSAFCLENKQDAAEWIDRSFSYDDHGEAKTIEIDEEQAEAVQVYLDAIRADQAKHGGRLLIEARFHLEWLHPEFFGTSDAPLLGDDAVLRVFDAKFGRGKVVEVNDNPQLAYYALGAIEALKGETIKKIELVIVQPRAPHRDGPVRRSPLLDHSDLVELADRLVTAAAEADGPNPTFKAGDHCKFCKAAGACKTLREFSFDAAQLDFDDDKGVIPGFSGEKTVNPLSMSEQQLAHALDAADVIEAWVKSVRYHAYTMMNGGRLEIPGWKIVTRKTNRKWLDETKAASELSLVFGLDESSIYKQKILSPAQIEKHLKTKDEKKALAELYAKPEGGTWIARVGDVREAKQPSAQTDFDDATDQW